MTRLRDTDVAAPADTSIRPATLADLPLLNNVTKKWNCAAGAERWSTCMDCTRKRNP